MSVMSEPTSLANTIESLHKDTVFGVGLVDDKMDRHRARNTGHLWNHFYVLRSIHPSGELIYSCVFHRDADEDRHVSQLVARDMDALIKELKMTR